MATTTDPSASGPRVNVFEYRSVVPASAAAVFRWHERPEALMDLVPLGRLGRIDERTGGLQDDGRVTFSFGIGPLRLRWKARHFGYISGRQFCDEQIRGPFAVWRHTHRFEPIETEQTLYEDHVEYAVRGGPLAERLLNPLVRLVLARSFAARHRIVRERVCGSPRGSAPDRY